MNKKSAVKYFVACWLLLSSNAMAKNTIASCEKKATTAEVSRCLGGIKEKKNRELQTWINNQTYILEDLARSSGRRTVLDMFERAQRNFIDYRENNCRWQYLAVSPDASAAVAFKKCYITLTQYRIDELAKLGE